MAHSTINSANSAFLTQDERIEKLLRSRYGQWISCLEVASPEPGHPVLQYSRAINTLRKKLLRAGDLERIENKTERVAGQVHGFFRIIKTVELLGLSTSNTPSPKSWEEICAEREEKMRRSEPSFELVP